MTRTDLDPARKPLMRRTSRRNAAGAPARRAANLQRTVPAVTTAEPIPTVTGP